MQQLLRRLVVAEEVPPADAAAAGAELVDTAQERCSCSESKKQQCLAMAVSDALWKTHNQLHCMRLGNTTRSSHTGDCVLLLPDKRQFSLGQLRMLR